MSQTCLERGPLSCNISTSVTFHICTILFWSHEVEFLSFRWIYINFEVPWTQKYIYLKMSVCLKPALESKSLNPFWPNSYSTCISGIHLTYVGKILVVHGVRVSQWYHLTYGQRKIVRFICDRDSKQTFVSIVNKCCTCRFMGSKLQLSSLMSKINLTVWNWRPFLKIFKKRCV